MTQVIDTRLDVTELAVYLEKVKEIPTVSKLMAGVYLRDFIVGLDIAGQLLAKAIQMDIKAKSALEHAEAIAFLENAAEYLETKKIKWSAEAAKKYIDIDPDVMKAKDAKARTEALVALLKNKHAILRMSHDSLKKIIYGDSYMTPFEGM
jgi:hypothetical protein